MSQSGKNVWRALFVVAFFATLSFPVLASAQGTHFIFEGQLGVSSPMGTESAESGLAVSGLSGFGGKVPGTELRGYLIGEFAYSEFDIINCQGGSLTRMVTDMSGGARALYAITPHVRIFADAMLSLAFIESQAFDEFGEYWIVDMDPRVSMVSAFGVQFRPVLFFSMGVRSRFGVLLDEEGLLPGDMEGWMNLTGSVTFHF